MDLYKELLIKVFEKEEICISFPNLSVNLNEVIENQSYNALLKIKRIIEDDSLDDFDCVEQIVRVLEEVGSSGGSRHDFF